MPYCEYCGRELSPRAVNCPNCGHPQRGVAPAAPPAYLAGWWSRVGAAIVDGLLVIPFVVVPLIFVPLGEGEEPPASFFLFLACIALGFIFYRVLMEGSRRGQTLGKMAAHIAVKDEVTAEPIGYGRALVRWAVGAGAWALFYIPGIVDVLFPLWDSKNQTLHDKAARSIVVKTGT